MTESSIRAQRTAGFTFVELVLTVSLMAMLAGVALPLASTMERRTRELELRQDLRLLRRAIETYHLTVEIHPAPSVNLTAEGWPEDLDVLVEGIDLGLPVKTKFLRRIPVDPFTKKAEWGKRSKKQDPDDSMWDGVNIFDVYSLAEGTALDGSRYREW